MLSNFSRHRMKQKLSKTLGCSVRLSTVLIVFETERR